MLEDVGELQHRHAQQGNGVAAQFADARPVGILQGPPIQSLPIVSCEQVAQRVAVGLTVVDKLSLGDLPFAFLGPGIGFGAPPEGLDQALRMLASDTHLVASAGHRLDTQAHQAPGGSTRLFRLRPAFGWSRFLTD